ncbi:hypothetical protein HYDPIDRAFT_106798 [Hydnomerulius pinastri MD-312]|nr:hypothetical protein HYDPIDRAFT_106798 [Hydnomerulius pinastri MD-312]
MPALKRAYSCDLIQAKLDNTVLSPAAKRRKLSHVPSSEDRIAPPKPGSRKLTSFNSLPPEIVIKILEGATPPNMFLDPHLGRGPHSAWCTAMQTKLSFLVVCKYWYDCAIKLLYRDIVFRRRTQIESFVMTLTNHLDLRGHVKSVHVSSFLVKANDTRLNRLFRMLPNATKFTVGMDRVAGLELQHYKERRCQFPHPESGMERITYLDIQDPASLDNFAIKLSLFKNLEFLAISLFYLVEFEPLPELPSDDPLTLWDLQELQVSVAGDNLYDDELLKSLTIVWELPSLCHLTFVQDNICADIIPAYKKILTAYGPQIKTLSLAVTRNNRRGVPRFRPPFLTTNNIQELIDLCPYLEHLVIPEAIELKNPSLFHPRIQRVDIWTADHTPESVAPPIRDLFTTEQFPKLKNVRLVDWGLLSVSGPRLPQLVPHIDKEHHQVAWRSSGVHIQHDIGRLFQRDMEHIDRYIADCTDYEDMDVYSSDEGSSDGDDDDSDSDDSNDDSSTGDSTYRAVSPSYSAYDSDEGDLETLRTRYDSSFTNCLFNRDIVDHVLNNLHDYGISPHNHPPSFIPGFYANGNPGTATLMQTHTVHTTAIQGASQ